MKISRNNQETAISLGVVLEARASELTQGHIGEVPEGYGPKYFFTK